MSKEPLHRRLFRVLLRLFPAEFRGDFGEQMAADFEDQRSEAAAQPRAVRRLWLRTTLDLLSRAPREHLDVLWRDVVYAFRSLHRHKASTAVAVASLAIGIGLNSAVFSVVYGVLWRELPFPDSDRLVQIGLVSPDAPMPGQIVSTWYQAVAGRARTLDAIAAASFGSVTIVEPGDPTSVPCPAVTPEFFAVLGTSPVVGRAFTRAEYAQALSDRSTLTGMPGSPRVMMLSHDLWLRLYGGDPRAVGRRVTLAGGEPVEIVGVMSPDPESLGGTLAAEAECWVPGGLVDAFTDILFVIGRVAPGASVQELQVELDVIDAVPQSGPAEPRRSLGAASLLDVVVGSVRTQLVLLFGAVVCVLLVTCANVANLLIARASGRRDELSTRVALGATRGRLVRQSLTESFLVVATGCAVGLLLAFWTVRAIVVWAPPDVPRLSTVGIDGPTFTLASLVSVVVATACGLLTALPTRGQTQSAARAAAGRVTPRVGRIRLGLAVAEIAVALVLVVGATLMVRTVRSLGAIELGFDPTHVVSVALPRARDPLDWEASRRAGLTAVERAQALPGVVAAGVGQGPLLGSVSMGGVHVPGDTRELRVRADAVSPGYFEALGVRLLAGRFFDERDMSGEGVAPIIVNATTARMLFAEDDSIGRTVLTEPTNEQLVVGVIADVRETSLEAVPGPTVYLPSSSRSRTMAGHMILKIDGEPEALVPALRSIVRAINPEEPFDGVASLQDRIDRETAPRRFVLRLVGLFSLLGLGLATIGVYGVLAEFVTQRVPEIGVRVAFGATTGNVVRLVLRQGWRLAAIGVPLGLAGAAALNGTMRAQVYGVSTLDPATYVAAALCLILATVAACLIPALRAARLDPVAALRAE